MQNWLSQNKTKTNVYMTIYGELLFHRFIVTYLLMNMIHQKLKKAANIYTVDNAGSCHFPPPPPPPPPNAHDPVNTKQFKWRHFWNGFGHSRKYAPFTSRVSIAAIFYIIELQLWTKSHKTCTSTEAMKCCFLGGMEGDGLDDFIRNFVILSVHTCNKY